MDISRLFRSEIRELMRSSVHISDYNPRKISDEGRQLLRDSMLQYGVVGGIVVNERTWNVVGGNQKIAILDEMSNGEDFKIRAEVISVDEKTEKQLNVILNSSKVGGDWDYDALSRMLPDIDWRAAGITDEDLRLMDMEYLLSSEDISSDAANTTETIEVAFSDSGNSQNNSVARVVEPQVSLDDDSEDDDEDDDGDEEEVDDYDYETEDDGEEEEVEDKRSFYESMYKDVLYESNNDFEIPNLLLEMQAGKLELPFSPWGANSRLRKDVTTYHFYVDDYRFSALFKNPINLLASGCKAVVEPNCSCHDQTPIAWGLQLIYQKRWLARYFQECGIEVYADLNVSHKFVEYNKMGIPKGYNAFATRGLDGWLHSLESDLQVAQEISGLERPNLIVYGGGKEVRKFCQEHGLLYVTDFINAKRI